MSGSLVNFFDFLYIYLYFLLWQQHGIGQLDYFTGCIVTFIDLYTTNDTNLTHKVRQISPLLFSEMLFYF